MTNKSITNSEIITENKRYNVLYIFKKKFIMPNYNRSSRY